MILALSATAIVIVVLLWEVMMPHLDGWALLDHSHERNPSLPVILMSAGDWIRRRRTTPIPDHAVFVQCSKSRAGLRHERNPAHSDLWNGTKVHPGEVGGRRPLCQMLSKVFVHLEHGHPVFAEHGLELVVRHDLPLVLRVLKLVLLDVVPHLAHHLSAGQRL